MANNIFAEGTANSKILAGVGPSPGCAASTRLARLHGQTYACRVRILCAICFFYGGLYICQKPHGVVLPSTPSSSHFMVNTRHHVANTSANLMQEAEQTAAIDSSTGLMRSSTDPIDQVDASQPATSSKPTFLLHVGLPKTGTTFLQCALCSQGNRTTTLLDRDDWVYLGTCPYYACQLDESPSEFLKHTRSSFFFDDRSTDYLLNPYGPVPHSGLPLDDRRHLPRLDRSFVRTVKRLRRQNKNVLVIYEGLHNLADSHIQALARFLEDRADFDVQVMVAYRPLYQWLPSKYNSLTKKLESKVRWPGKVHQLTGVVGDHMKPFDLDNRGDFSDLVRFIESTQQHPTETTFRNFARYFADVSVLPLHCLPPPTNHVQTSNNSTKVDSILHYMFCLWQPTPHICESVQMGLIGGTNVPSNPSVSFSYDMLATAAYEAGMFFLPRSDDKESSLSLSLSSHRMSTATSLTRAFVVESIRYQQEQVWNTTSRDFPTICLPNRTLHRLEELSWTLERQLLFGTGATALRISSSSSISIDTNESEHSLHQLHQEGFGASWKAQVFCSIDTNRTLSDPKWSNFLQSLRPE